MCYVCQANSQGALASSQFLPTYKTRRIIHKPPAGRQKRTQCYQINLRYSTLNQFPLGRTHLGGAGARLDPAVRLGMITALAIWITQRKKSAYVAYQALQALSTRRCNPWFSCWWGW